MKNTLIVYYSFSGNNKLLAEKLASDLDAEICPIIERKKRTNLRMVLDIFLKRSPAILPLEKNLNSYDKVIFLAPLWAGRIANPLKSLLVDEGKTIKEYSFVTFCGGYGKPSQLGQVREELTALTGKAPSGMFELDVADMFSEEKRQEIKTVTRYRAKPEDLNFFASKLAEIESRV